MKVLAERTYVRKTILLSVLNIAHVDFRKQQTRTFTDHKRTITCRIKEFRVSPRVAENRQRLWEL